MRPVFDERTPPPNQLLCTGRGQFMLSHRALRLLPQLNELIHGSADLNPTPVGIDEPIGDARAGVPAALDVLTNHRCIQRSQQCSVIRDIRRRGTSLQIKDADGTITASRDEQRSRIEIAIPEPSARGAKHAPGQEVGHTQLAQQHDVQLQPRTFEFEDVCHGAIRLPIIPQPDPAGPIGAIQYAELAPYI